jgi:hypothetical protein
MVLAELRPCHDAYQCAGEEDLPTRCQHLAPVGISVNGTTGIQSDPLRLEDLPYLIILDTGLYLFAYLFDDTIPIGEHVFCAVRLYSIHLHSLYP